MKLEALISGIVMIGHSLFGADNPQMLDQLLKTHDQQVTVEAQIINGAPLSYNWQHSANAEGVDARARLRQPVGAVIVTEAIPLSNHLKWSDTAGAVTHFYELARNANPDVEFYLQETWHSLNSGTGVEVAFDDEADKPWRQRLEQDLPRWQAVVDTVNANTGGSVKLLPAGQAMARLDDAILAGTMPGLRDIRDVFADDIHPNATGFYFLALLQYAVLTGKDPSGLPHQLKDRWGKPYAAPPAALAERLQDIAWAAAQGTQVTTAALPADPTALPTDPALPALDMQQAKQSRPEQSPAPQPARQPLPPMAVNPAGITDWSTQAPFLDHFKTARPWIGHLPRQWGGVTAEELREAGYLDANGWPTAIPPELGSIGTVILTDLPETASSLTGRYVLRFQGSGIVEVAGRAQNVRYGKQEVRFDFTPGPGPVVIMIQRTGRDGDYVRNITVVKEADQTAYDQGGLFNPLWLDRIDGFEVLRMMNWMDINNSDQTGWEDRPQLTDYTWAQKGVPVEVMLSLANTLGADPWFTMPHKADDIYVREFARLVEQGLDEDLRAYVEYSNEVWNWQFQQAAWADAQAKARWGGENLWMQFYGGRAAEIAQIWSAVFGDNSPRLVRVLSTQTGWLGLEEQLLKAPMWQAEQPDRQEPAAYFDAYAVTGYFGGILGTRERAGDLRAWLAESRAQASAIAADRGLETEAATAFVERHQYDVASAQAAAELRDGLISGDMSDTLTDLLSRVLPYHADVAAQHGLDLIMYEGGTHVVGLGPLVDDAELTNFFIHFNYTPEMGALYQELLTGWTELGGQLFNVFVDVSAPGKWGSWGALRTLSDDNPRWDAVEAMK
jgi:hypothetical protein